MLASQNSTVSMGDTNPHGGTPRPMRVRAEVLIWMWQVLVSMPVNAMGVLCHIQWQISRREKGEHDPHMYWELL